MGGTSQAQGPPPAELGVGGALSVKSESILGFEALDDGLFVEALTHFKVALKKHPDDASLLYGRGWAYMELKQWDDSIKDFTRGIELEPKNAELFVGRSLARHGAGDYNGLVADMEIAAKLDPENQDDLDNAYSTRNWARARLFFFGLGAFVVLLGLVPFVRSLRAMIRAEKAGAAA